ncbi:hypothetical protein ABFS82_03G107800 [Erythranthe guttata]|uniref:F-box domain-containing protein n=1 Tax=Erythranthe guttata TaxID=4155 RepID=A0A022Q5H0_ERYGU|nr:PREDICTED: F-box protein At3g07870-like [Erythranthe guttata]EYU22874.1 hypothetical protein MIMGU_mgv1a007673mg [Erythranthe guttata]|eukprot:XP_012854741.1 PREDICTED: F-box protein At3g07870-like [Erythranthe guttata]
MKEPRRNPISNLQLFRNLPLEITIDILSRLPIRRIAICKCVCNSWRELLRSREFLDFHLSKSVPGLLIGHDWDPENYRIFEFVDELGLETHDLHYNTVTKFNSMGFADSSELKGSASGLLFFIRKVSNYDSLYICNPITREYIELPYDGIFYSDSRMVTSVFGVSKITRQHKVIRVFHEIDNRRECDTAAHLLSNVTKSICLVYVLGTGLWRSIAPPAPFIYGSRSIGASVNGNIHWMVENADGSHCVSCFNIETETFSTFAPPIFPVSKKFLVGLVVLGDCLCACDNTFDEIVIWSMKVYGDDKSWRKEFVVKKDGGYVCDCDDCRQVVSPIKVFKDGDILMAWDEIDMIYYSNKTKSITSFDMVRLDDDDGEGLSAMLHTSSFLSLGSFRKESVSSF